MLCAPHLFTFHHAPGRNGKRSPRVPQIHSRRLPPQPLRHIHLTAGRQSCLLLIAGIIRMPWDPDNSEDSSSSRPASQAMQSGMPFCLQQPTIPRCAVALRLFRLCWSTRFLPPWLAISTLQQSAAENRSAHLRLNHANHSASDGAIITLHDSRVKLP